MTIKCNAKIISSEFLKMSKKGNPIYVVVFTDTDKGVVSHAVTANDAGTAYILTRWNSLLADKCFIKYHVTKRGKKVIDLIAAEL